MFGVKKSILARLALLLATLIWGSSFVMMKTAVTDIPPNLLLATRFTGACLILAAVFSRKLKKALSEEPKKYLIAGALAGAALFAAYCTQTYGLMRTSPGKNAFLTAVYVVIVPFLFWPVDRKRPTVDNITAAVLCVAGIGLVSLSGASSAAASSLTGDILTLIGGFFYACHIIVLARTASGCDPVVISILQFGSAAVLAWITTFTFEGVPDYAKLPWTGGLAFSVCYLVFACTAVALMLQTVGQKYTSPSSAALILSLESVFGVLFSIMFGDEALSLQIIVGFVLIFVAILCSELSPIEKIKRRSKSVSAVDPDIGSY